MADPLRYNARARDIGQEQNVTKKIWKIAGMGLDPLGLTHRTKDAKAVKGKAHSMALARKTGYAKETAEGKGIHQYTDFKDFVSKNKGYFAGMRSKDVGRVATWFKKSKSDYEKKMLSHQERTRKSSVTRQGVQRRAFFEEASESTSSGMRATTGV